MILVLGSVGAIGRALANELVSRGVDVRAAVREFPDFDEMPVRGVTLVEADMRKPDSLERAMDGVEAVFLNSKDMPGYVEREKNVVDAAKRMRVPRVIKLTRPFAHADTPSIVHRNHWEVAEYLKASGVPYTLVRPQAWMQNALLDAPTIQAQGMVFSAIRDAQLAYIDQRDCATFLATVLLQDGHLGGDYLISSDRTHAWPEVVALVSKAIEAPITVVDMSFDDLKSAFLGMGIPEWFADAYTQLLRYAVEGPPHRATTTFRDIVGYEAVTFEHFIEDNHHAFVRPLATA